MSDVANANLKIPFSCHRNGNEYRHQKVKTKRPEHLPVPPTFIGQHKVGVFSAIIRKGRAKYGFISICYEPEYSERCPSIYFPPGANGGDLQKGYTVSFDIRVDDLVVPMHKMWYIRTKAREELNNSDLKVKSAWIGALAILFFRVCVFVLIY